MGYTLNFNLIWRHFDKLWGGLLLSLELRRLLDRHRHRHRARAGRLHVSGGRVARSPDRAPMSSSSATCR